MPTPRRSATPLLLLFFVNAIVTMSGIAIPAVAQADEPTSDPTPPPPPPSPPPSSVTAPSGSAPSGSAPSGSVPVNVESGSKNAVLERRVSIDELYGRTAFVVPIHTATEKWEPICVAPCRLALDRGGLYRVARVNGVSETDEFTLPPGVSQVDLHIEPGNLWMRRASRVFLGLGTAAAIVSGALFTTASKFDDEEEARIAGAITGGAGLLLLAVGIPLAIMSKTHVTAGQQKVAAPAPRGVAPQLTPGGLVF